MPKRRGNGEGTIVKRNDDRWMAAITVGRTPDGKPRRVVFYGKTRKEVQEKLDEARQQQKAGIQIVTNRITVAEWFTLWMNTYMRPHLRPTTFDSYLSKLEKHIIPAIGAVQLRQLQATHLQKFYNDLLASGRVDGRGGLSARTTRYVHAIIHHGLQQAVKEQLIPRNPADAVSLPSQQRKEIKPLTTNQAQHFLAAIKGERLYPAFMLELATGLRLGELLGLRWGDLDMEKGIVHVQQSLVRTKAGLVFQEPKTERSRRSIPLPENAVRELKRWKAWQNGEKLALGEAYRDFNLVFCKETGEPLDPGEFSKYFSRLLEEAGLPHVRFHDLRHTHATQLLQLGVHVKVVQERLGHSTVTMTLDTYSHVLPGLQEDAAARLNSLLEPKKNPSAREGE